MWFILLTDILAASSLAILLVLTATVIGTIGDDGAGTTAEARGRTRFLSDFLFDWRFPLAFEERLAHDFARKPQVLKYVGRAFGLLVRSKFDAELLLRILAGADQYHFRPQVIKKVGWIDGSETPALEFLL
jgi:hypothetical protein